MFREIIAEMGGFGEPQLIGDLLYGDRRVLKKGLGLGNGFLRDPGTDGFTGFTFDDIAQVIGMETLLLGIILHPEHFFRFAIDQVAVMLFQASFKKLYDLAAAVPLIDGIIVAPEVFFYL